MRIPTEWLQDYVDLDRDAEALAELLLKLGLEIEEIEDAPAGLGGQVLVAEVTPNRGDCLSMLGVASEVAAATGAELRYPAAELIESLELVTADHCAVRIEDEELCPRYAARLITGVRQGESPDWMKQRLLACGQRPLNVLVDVTNYVLFELGQPLHSFDHDLLGELVVVRRAHDGEVLVTLDGVKRTLTSEQLLITDGEQPVALAGVMGGANTEVTEETTSILLEGAHFYGPNIRRTARSLGLESEASYRFARTVDPNLPTLALERAAGLYAQYAGGQVAQGVVDVKAQPFQPKVIMLRPERCNSFLGSDISFDQMGGYLTSLGFQVLAKAGKLEVTVPTRRPDLEREVDLIEEVARLHGYDNVPMGLPRAGHQTARLTPRQRLERRVRELLLACGLHEVSTFSLTSATAMAKAGYRQDLDRIGAVVLNNALSEEYALLRWSMLPSMLEIVAKNRAVHADPIRIFELGRTYARLDRSVTDAQAQAAGRLALGRTAEALPLPCLEERTLAGAVTGRQLSSHWNQSAESLAPDFYEVKGIVELLLNELQLTGVEAHKCDEPLFEPGRAARLVQGDAVFAVLGEVNYEIRQAYDLDEPVLVFELDLGWLLDHADTTRVSQPLPRFPAALRDIAVVLPRETREADVRRAVATAGGELLERVELFDVYQGKGIPAGQRSLAYNLTFRLADRTLTDTAVDAVMERIIAVLGAEFDAKLRE